VTTRFGSIAGEAAEGRDSDNHGDVEPHGVVVPANSSRRESKEADDGSEAGTAVGFGQNHAVCFLLGAAYRRFRTSAAASFRAELRSTKPGK
jgi:hypothetical protein